MRVVVHLAVVAVFVAALLAGALAAPSDDASPGSSVSPRPSAVPRPSVILVADFDIDAGSVDPSEGGVVRRPRIRPQASDPESRARALVDLMATSLVKDLTAAGFNARRIQPGDALPAEGWLLTGVFTQVDAGQRVRRAVVGFGAGQTQLEVAVDVNDLSQGAPRSLYTETDSATSGGKPGAVITLNPYAAAARFVMAGHDLEKNVKQTAARITSRLVERTGGGAKGAPPSGTP